MKTKLLPLAMLSLSILLSNLSAAQNISGDTEDDIIFHVELKIKPGQFDNFKRLVKEIASSVKSSELTTLNYEWSISQDSTVCHILERYADSDATVAHLKMFNVDYAKRMDAMVETTGFTVYGHPNDELKQMLGVSASNAMIPFAGFAR